MEKLVGYMDITDFKFHIQNDGAILYSSIEDINERKPCIDECGIYEVEIIVRRVVKAPNFSASDFPQPEIYSEELKKMCDEFEQLLCDHPSKKQPSK